MITDRSRRQRITQRPGGVRFQHITSRRLALMLYRRTLIIELVFSGAIGLSTQLCVNASSPDVHQANPTHKDSTRGVF